METLLLPTSGGNSYAPNPNMDTQGRRQRRRRRRLFFFAYFLFLLILPHGTLTPTSAAKQISIGVILNLQTKSHRKSLATMRMAVDDFYALRRNHSTTISLRVSDSKQDAVDAAAAVQKTGGLLQNKSSRTFLAKQFSPPVATNDLKEDGNWEGTIAGLEAMNFITFTSPHLGLRGHKQLPFLCMLPFLEQRASEAEHLIVGRTENHLFLTKDDGRPLLLRMVDDGEDIRSALRFFKCRVVYANANYDHMYHLLVEDEKYPHIVNVDEGKNKNIFEVASSDCFSSVVRLGRDNDSRSYTSTLGPHGC